MAPAATNGDAAAAATAVLDTIKPPPGVIIPPPGEIREVIEKTAGYVVRGGVGIEERLRENHGSNPKFSFVMSRSDPYNPYYEWRKDEYREGRGTSVAAGRAGETPATPAKEEPKGPVKPPDFQFSARMPRMNQKDLEVVRLTALFVARNGRQFMTSLAQREAGNPQFQFLIPNHTFHNFFQHMIDQYTLLLKEGGASGEGTKAQKARMVELQQNVDDKYAVLGRARQRAEYAAWQEKEKQKKEEEEEKQKEDYARIDWNDFVIVETILFTDSDESANLPPPTTLNDIQYASLEEKNKFSINSNLRIEEAFPFDDTSYNAYPLQAAANLPHHPVQTGPQYPASMPRAVYNGAVQPVRTMQSQDDEDVQRIQEREQQRLRMQQAQAEAKGGAPMKIKENYVPRAAAKAANRSAALAICPNCKQQIPLNELEEHMRSIPAPCPFRYRTQMELD
jgi:splicing factor 3A subunit 1